MPIFVSQITNYYVSQFETMNITCVWSGSRYSNVMCDVSWISKIIICMGLSIHSFLTSSCVVKQIALNIKFGSTMWRKFRAFKYTSVLKVIQSVDNVLLQTALILVNWIVVHGVPAFAVVKILFFLKFKFVYSDSYIDNSVTRARFTLFTTCMWDWRIWNGAYGSPTYANR